VIIVTGTVLGTPATIDELTRLSLEHVRRSRREPGCISHAVHRHVEEPLRLVFVEQWTDKDALLAHFGVPASGEFVQAAAALTAEPPGMEIFEATPTRV
jgi:quinol monooxygenase YgiN